MKKIWINKTSSFKEAENFDDRYYSGLGPSERLGIVQSLRENFFKIKGRTANAGRKGLRKSVKIIQ